MAHLVSNDVAVGVVGHEDYPLEFATIFYGNLRVRIQVPVRDYQNA
jgi:hypothetical protein